MAMALADIPPNATTAAAPKRRRDEDDSTALDTHPPARRSRGHDAALPRICDMEQLRSFKAAGEAGCVVVYTAVWEPGSATALAAAVRAASAASPPLPIARADFCDDDGGVVFYESALSAVPAVHVYCGGKLVGQAAGAVLRDAATAEQAVAEAIVQAKPELQHAPMEVDGMPPLVHSKAEFEQATSAPGLTVVDFFATWCKPCMRIMPELPQMARDYPDVKFIKVDRDELKDLHDACGVQKIPTFQVYKAGSRLDSLQHSDHFRVRAMIDKHRGVLQFDEDF
eukprot:TRINITY_DN5164_c0_g1_i1.p1 TRINITY_DN5164_c0_g1~~TRINITY_DN5164_c0_g1_i1.p1  ORF type:complete len:283 (+),score=97.57 TRINITY_DN5164_c0_g1_i1:85-933(+)